MTNKNELKTYSLMPDEIEALLLTDFGNKIQPVDTVKLSKQKQRTSNAAVHKARHEKPEAQAEAEVESES